MMGILLCRAPDRFGTTTPANSFSGKTYTQYDGYKYQNNNYNSEYSSSDFQDDLAVFILIEILRILFNVYIGNVLKHVSVGLDYIFSEDGKELVHAMIQKQLMQGETIETSSQIVFLIFQIFCCIVYFYLVKKFKSQENSFLEVMLEQIEWLFLDLEILDGKQKSKRLVAVLLSIFMVLGLVYSIMLLDATARCNRKILLYGYTGHKKSKNNLEKSFITNNYKFFVFQFALLCSVMVGGIIVKMYKCQIRGLLLFVLSSLFVFLAFMQIFQCLSLSVLYNAAVDEINNSTAAFNNLENGL